MHSLSFLHPVLYSLHRAIHKNVKWKRGPRNPVNPHMVIVYFFAYTLERASTTHWAPNGSVPQNICSSDNFLLVVDVEEIICPWKESAPGKKTIQGVWFDLMSGIAAMCYFSALSPPPPPPHTPLQGVNSLLGHTYFPTATPHPHWRC